MFCNKCGNQLADGMRFCNNCGAPVMPAAPQAPVESQEPTTQVAPAFYAAPQEPVTPYAPVAPQEPIYQEPLEPLFPTPEQSYDDTQATMIPPYSQDAFEPVSYPEPEKKKGKAGLIIGIAAALVVAIAVFCVLAFVKPGFLLKDDKSKADGSSTTASTVSTLAEKPSGTTNPSSQPGNSTPTTPDADFSDAEKVADELFKDMIKLDFKKMFENEILGWDAVEAAIDLFVVEKTGESSAKKAYEKMADYGINATNAEEFLDVILNSAGDIDDIFAASYGDDYTATATHTVTEITKDDAEAFIDKTKVKIDAFDSYGIKSGDVDWDDIEKFVQVKSTQVISGSLKTDSTDVLMILGYIDGEWKAVYIDDNDTQMCLYSLSFLDAILN